jgi:hypothetical protein
LPTVEALLNQLDHARHRFGPPEATKITATLGRLTAQRFRDAESLIRFHEILLFLRAYPQNQEIVRLVEKELSRVPERIKPLRESEVDLSAFDNPEVSGIAGTSVTDTFSYFIIRCLVKRHPSQVRFDWNWFEDENRLAETWPRFMPLLIEDAAVEANVPYREWLRAARDKQSAVSWLLTRFERLPRSDFEKAELYDGQKLYVTWNPSYRSSRTGMRLPLRKIFYHRSPLIQRRDISFKDELQKPAPPLERLSVQDARRMLDLARESSTVRYRELYGFTHGDERRVLGVDLGRGVNMFIVGVPAERRLPLRAYHAAMIFKNGIAIGYFEGLSLFERMESGFNLYYTFRDGETAWLYARTLNVFRQLLGVTAFSLDPYQIGHENEEGVESGAFWFYRKLGFRSTSRRLRELTEKEETKLAKRAGYRSSARILRELAREPMILELKEDWRGDWDRFQLRRLGFAVQRRMAAEFSGDAERMRSSVVNRISKKLGISGRNWSTLELLSLKEFAPVLALIPDLSDWSREEKQALVEIIRAKAGVDEKRYLRLMQRHEQFRNELIKLGSRVSTIAR